MKGRTDPNKITLIRNLKKAAATNQVKIWSVAAEELSKSNRKRVAVNLSHVNRITNPGEPILVLGKILGSGDLTHAIEIAAESYSKTAKHKIIESGSKLLTIEELIQKNPKGTGIRLIK